MQPKAIATRSFAPIKVQEQAGPEQHGEQSPHLAFEEDQVEGKNPIVCRAAPAGQIGREERRSRPGKADDIDSENAKNGNPADQVKRANPGSLYHSPLLAGNDETVETS